MSSEAEGVLAVPGDRNRPCLNCPSELHGTVADEAEKVLFRPGVSVPEPRGTTCADSRFQVSPLKGGTGTSPTQEQHTTSKS